MGGGIRQFGGRCPTDCSPTTRQEEQGQIHNNNNKNKIIIIIVTPQVRTLGPLLSRGTRGTNRGRVAIGGTRISPTHGSNSVTRVVFHIGNGCGLASSSTRFRTQVLYLSALQASAAGGQLVLVVLLNVCSSSIYYCTVLLDGIDDWMRFLEPQWTEDKKKQSCFSNKARHNGPYVVSN